MRVSFDARATALLATGCPGEALVIAYGPAVGCCRIPRLITRWSSLSSAVNASQLARVDGAEGIAIFVDRRLVPYFGAEIAFTTAGFGRRRRISPAAAARIRANLTFGVAPNENGDIAAGPPPESSS
jgi:hypothetical protein